MTFAGYFKMHVEFLHCNACFTYPSFSQDDQIRFWLTECGHVVCHSCLNKRVEANQGMTDILRVFSILLLLLLLFEHNN